MLNAVCSKTSPSWNILRLWFANRGFQVLRGLVAHAVETAAHKDCGEQAGVQTTYFCWNFTMPLTACRSALSISCDSCTTRRKSVMDSMLSCPRCMSSMMFFL